MAGTVLLMFGELMTGIIGSGCLIAALFGYFLSFASGVPAFFDKYPAQKYRGQNLLIFRTLSAKLSTMGIIMAIISMIFTATIITEGSGLMFNGLIRGRSAENACFDLYFAIEGEDQDPSPYLDYIAEYIPVEQSVLYQVYLTDSPTVRIISNHRQFTITITMTRTPFFAGVTTLPCVPSRVIRQWSRNRAGISFIA